jgi:putative intracellular protease/amidase
MSANINAFGRKKKILMIVASPVTHPTLGFPVGFWAAELMHPWFEFLEAGFDLELASIPGAPVSIDPLSHPSHEGRMMAGMSSRSGI